MQLNALYNYKPKQILAKCLSIKSISLVSFDREFFVVHVMFILPFFVSNCNNAAVQQNNQFFPIQEMKSLIQLERTRK